MTRRRVTYLFNRSKGSVEEIKPGRLWSISVERQFGVVRFRPMLTISTLKQTVLVSFVVCVLAAACSSNDGTTLDVPETSTTVGVAEPPVTTEPLPDPTTTVVDDTTTTAVGHTDDGDDGHTNDATTTTASDVDDGATTTTASDVDDGATTTTASDVDDGATTTTTSDVDDGATTTSDVDDGATTTTTSDVDDGATTTTTSDVDDGGTTTTTTTTTTATASDVDDGGNPGDLATIDCPGGTIMGRFHFGQPTGCRLPTGEVLCLTAPPHPTKPELRLYNAAEWLPCPGAKPDWLPCSTTQVADHSWIDEWEYVFASADQPPYVRPLWHSSVDLTPGLWFGELCVRHNEGSQIGVPEPHRMYALVFPEPFCDGLPTFHSDYLLEGEEQIHLSNGFVRLLRTNTGWHRKPDLSMH